MSHPDLPDRLVTRSLERAELMESDVDEMWNLYAKYYGGTSEEQFRSDLSTKTHVLLCSDSVGRIGGFSTIEVAEHEFRDEKVGILFSGDTIIRHEFWSRNDLAFSWIDFASREKLREPDRPLYWLLIVKGHRTYRYLGVFGKRYYPAPGRDAPEQAQALIDSLAASRFGDAYDPSTGLIRFPDERGFLKQPWAEIPSTALGRPEVAYFLERNPDYAEGVELVCLCEVDRTNMKPLTRRIFDKAAEDVVFDS